MTKNDTVALSPEECARIRGLIKAHGIVKCAALLAVHPHTLLKAASECPVWKHVAEVVRARMVRP